MYGFFDFTGATELEPSWAEVLFNSLTCFIVDLLSS